MKSKRRVFFLWSLAIFILALCSWFPFSYGFDRQEVAELEEYLIDFSKKIEGHRLSTGPLPSDLNEEKFFSILKQYYPDSEIIRKVKEYPVRVGPEGSSYVLVLCDQESKFILYKDFGRTITFVDHPYWRENEKVDCSE
jgi:hypothetical protein